jgi:hypothetical protein
MLVLHIVTFKVVAVSSDGQEVAAFMTTRRAISPPPPPGLTVSTPYPLSLSVTILLPDLNQDPSLTADDRSALAVFAVVLCS